MTKREQYGTFLMGIILGLVGGLLAAIVDRYFAKFGVLYEVPVAVIFFGFVWWLERYFRKKVL